jgi:uncharacterized protein (UPF0303 family)
MDEELKLEMQKITKQEATLVFGEFSKGDAWALGQQIRQRLLDIVAPAVIDIRLGDECLFYTSLEGATEANQDWARRKRNLVNLVNSSSYLLSLQTKLGFDVVEAMGLDPRNYVAAGGCFPIHVINTGIVGTITISGLPERDDHRILVEEIAKYLSLDLGDNAL